MFQNEDDVLGFPSQLASNGKRAHHNELERKRRDHIKDSFSGLKDAIPTLQVSSGAIFLVWPLNNCLYFYRETSVAEPRF